MIREQEAREAGLKVVEETELPQDLGDDKMFRDVKEKHETELKVLKHRKKEMERRPELTDLRKELTEQRAIVYDMCWKQEMMEQEMEVQRREEALEKRKRERDLEDRQCELELEFRKMDMRGHGRKDSDAIGMIQETSSAKAESWLDSQAMDVHMDWEARSMPGATYGHEQQLAEI